MGIWNYQLLNVFAESPLGGNPLCVVEQAEGLSDAQMQALALQFNLSETVFLLRSEQANADRKSTRLNSSHSQQSRMPSSA